MLPVSFGGLHVLQPLLTQPAWRVARGLFAALLIKASTPFHKVFILAVHVPNP